GLSANDGFIECGNKHFHHFGSNPKGHLSFPIARIMLYKITQSTRQIALKFTKAILIVKN
ncbi:MAG: hypothetical protein R6U19_04960, partial [Bacteroidales bacterium]